MTSSPTVVESSSSTNDNTLPEGTKPKRTSKQPAYLHDYYCNMTETDIPYNSLASYILFKKISKTYKSYICAIALNPEPTSFTQGKKFDEWLKVMNEELIALENTQTYDIFSLLPGKHTTGCKWVYKVKLNADGTLERYKAWLVAKGYTQH